MSLEHRSPALGEAPAATLAAIDDALARLGRKRHGSPLRIDSARNENYRVETGAGPLFVRFHRRSRSRERIDLNLAAMAHAGDRGIPVARPLADEAGHVLFPGGGRFLSVYRWIEAGPDQAGEMTPARAAAIGEAHGRVHQALLDFAHPSLAAAGEYTWDPMEAVSVLSRVDDLIRYYPAPGEEQLRVQAGLREQLALLESGFPRPAAEFAELPHQPLHGDIHDRNVLLGASGRAIAVVDWDMVALGPPLAEVVRALDFSRALDDEASLAAYVAAYAAEAPYPADQVQPSIDLWAQAVIHNTWVYRARFIEGDPGISDAFLAAKPVRVRQLADLAFRRRLAGVFLRFAP